VEGGVGLVRGEGAVRVNGQVTISVKLADYVALNATEPDARRPTPDAEGTAAKLCLHQDRNRNVSFCYRLNYYEALRAQAGLTWKMSRHGDGSAAGQVCGTVDKAPYRLSWRW
jgi:hypothetical protein